jgi:LEA14-like dessication related protein
MNNKNITLSEQFRNLIKKYHTVGSVPKSNRKFVKRGKINTPNTQIHDRPLPIKGYSALMYGIEYI